MKYIKSLIEKVVSRIKRSFNLILLGIGENNKDLTKRCLLYYKTDAFYRENSRNFSRHTNGWESIEIVRILNKLGYVVDVIDRSVKNHEPKNIYDLFIGNASGNSGKYFSKYAKNLSRAIKIAYLTGPEPSLSNKLVKERYDQFFIRTKIKAEYMRISSIPFNDFANESDYFFCIGEEDQFSYNSYKKYNKKIYSIKPSSNPKFNFNNKWFKSRNKNEFLCIAGSSLICKGVDLLIESFKNMPELTLHICGPEEEGLSQAYKTLIKKKNNINFYGIVDMNGEFIQKLAAKCAYSILNSAAEGCCTSMTSSMNMGLVPIINYEVGINIKNFGFKIPYKKNFIKDIQDICKKASNLSDLEYQNRVHECLIDAKNYSTKSFTESFTNALIKIQKLT